ncbi:signal recognition particle-docking protein FtsY [Enterococcus sp. 8G7_MSG3316]|uniref:Signal recognition particle receptor FtsY n=1 Tax=Candidatus Enterococcus testudinis TaxID=1834191 RepID=A0A242A2J2_9ENTE|nr:signal recognition particle-docking protein FtsY [Enterococcus sp. 8G7_MSG3316]OTN75257.1 signal recognition particle-docking protein FtsY [Enterococcus sp. 8G7_MSG3316]
MGFFDKIKKALIGETTETTETTETSETVDTPATSDNEGSSTEPVHKANDAAADLSDVETHATVVPTQEPIEPQEPAEDGTTKQASMTPTDTDSTTFVKTQPSVPSAEATATDTAKETVQDKYTKGLSKSRKTFGQRMNELFANFRTVDEDFFEEVEETLIGADVGFDAAMKIADALRQEVKLRNVKKTADVQNVIIEKLVDLYGEAGIDEVNTLNMQPNLTVILFVGVNGVGKTTSIGKLAHQFKAEGKKVLLAAADTFRAGAIDQLVVWGERAGVEVVRGNAGGDPAAVVFDAMERAKAEDADVLLVDTAGRLQNKVNLMNELEKIKRIIQRVDPSAPHEVLLVLDATTGQNAMNQAKQFKETTDVSGLVLTKLDGTAKGGIVLAIRNELRLPVKLVGLGEGIDDLEPFDPNEFVVGLFKGLIKD